MKWQPITDLAVSLHEDYQEGKLILQPDYQREFVWTAAAQSQFIETILCGFPVAQIYYHSQRNSETKKTIRYVVDGQQRLTSIFLFLSDELKLKGINDNRFKNKTYSEIEKKFPEIIEKFHEEYLMPGILITKASEEEIRDIYIRINKYTVNLNSQELRTAMYKGDFLRVSQDLTNDIDFWEETNFFSASNTRRMLDIEFISELLSVIVSQEVQDKKNKLNEFYDNYMEMGNDKINYIKQFTDTLNLIRIIFNIGNDKINLMRYKQKSDFYSLFSGLFLNFILKGRENTIINNVNDIRTLFIFLDNNIRPTSKYDMLVEYAIKCTSSSNDKFNRIWRQEFLIDMINYVISNEISEKIAIFFTELKEENSNYFIDDTDLLNINYIREQNE